MRRRSLVCAVVCLLLTACDRSVAWSDFAEEAKSYQAAQQGKLEKEFGLSRYEDYRWSPKTAQVAFAPTGDRPALVADIVFVGSLSKRSKTWLWGWDNPLIAKELTKKLDAVKNFGKERSYRQLMDAKWAAGESEAEAVTAAAALILKAQGTLHVPSNNGGSYLLLNNVRPVKPPARPPQ